MRRRYRKPGSRVRFVVVYSHRPVIGIIGGIGSGKSFVSSMFGELGALVIHADANVHAAYQTDAVKDVLRSWWPGVVRGDGGVDKKAIAVRIFNDAAERKRLEGLLHPIVNAMRERQMQAAADDPAVTAFVWDTPLLVETGLHRTCDAVVFVDAPLEVRLARVAGRGWEAAELAKRENSQMPLDNKRRIADYVISNATDAEAARRQVRQVLSELQSKSGKP
ncbi:MAG TPA: dephospho-CoA kinase [Tepidisphaeraceae bacterium]